MSPEKKMIDTTTTSRFKMNQRSFEFITFASLCKTMGVESYVEVGVGAGGSARFMREIGVERIVGIDILKDRPKHFPKECFYLTGDSKDPGTVHDAVVYLGSKPDAVFIDTDHSLQSTLAEYELWWPNTKILLGFHDICLTGTGVPVVWNKLKSGIRSLEIIARDDYSNTENPNDRHPNGEWAGIGVIFKC